MHRRRRETGRVGSVRTARDGRRLRVNVSKRMTRGGETRVDGDREVGRGAGDGRRLPGRRVTAGEPGRGGKLVARARRDPGPRSGHEWGLRARGPVREDSGGEVREVTARGHRRL